MSLDSLYNILKSSSGSSKGFELSLNCLQIFRFCSLKIKKAIINWVLLLPIEIFAGYNNLLRDLLDKYCTYRLSNSPINSPNIFSMIKAEIHNKIVQKLLINVC